MMLKWYYLIKKEIILFLRNPILLAVLLYFAVPDIYQAASSTSDPVNYPIGIYNLDQGYQSQEIISRLRTPYFDIKTQINSEHEIKALIDNGTISAVIIFPKNFSRDLNANQTPAIEAIFDGTSCVAAEAVIGYLSTIVSDYNLKLLTAQNIPNEKLSEVPFVEFTPQFRFNPTLNEGWTNALQELYMVLTLLGILLTATAFVNEKQFGTIEQLLVSPLRPYEVVATKIISMILILISFTLIAVFVALKPMGVPMEGSIWQFLIITLLYCFTITGYGLVLATFSNNLTESILISLAFLIPILILSGIYTPFELMPNWLQQIMSISPLRYYLLLSHGVFLKGLTIMDMIKDFSILFSLGLGSFFLGLWRFKRSFS